MNQEKIGDFLRTLRKAKGLSQQEVADNLMVTQKTVSRWENGEGVPDISIISDVARFYDVTVDELLDGERRVKDQSTTTIKRKEMNRTKLCLRNLMAPFNLFVGISLSSYLLFIFVALIVLFATGNEVVSLVLLLLPAIGSLIAFIVGYIMTKNKIIDIDEFDNVDIDFIKKEIKKKTLLFVDCYVALSLVTLLIIWFMLYINNIFTSYSWIAICSNLSFMVVGGLIYLIIRPLLKEDNFDLSKFKDKLPLMFTLTMIVPLLFIFRHDIYPYNVGVGVNEVNNLGLFFCFDYLTNYIFTIIGAVLFITFVVLSIIFARKDYKKLFVFVPLILVATILPLLDFHFFILLGYGIRNTIDITSTIMLLVSIGLFVTYEVLKKKLNNN